MENTADYILENVLTLNPFISSYNDYFDPSEEFKTDSEYINELINESSETTKKNILNKIWSTIKKAVKWIGKKIVQIVRGIKRALLGRKKTANQILREIKANRHSIKYDAADSNDPLIGKKAAEAGYYSFIEGFYKDGIMINLAGLVAINPEKVPVKGKNINGGGTRASEVISLILNPKPLNDYIDFFKQLTGKINSNDLTEADLKKIYDECNEFAGRPSIIEYAADAAGNIVKGKYKEIYISIDQFMDFQKKVDELCKVGEEFDNIYNQLHIKFTIDNKNEAKYIKIMNELAWACVNLQGGLHAISNGLEGIYDIDPGYIGSIKTPKMLAQFVSESLKIGMPNKYLVRNIYLVSDEILKGTPNLDKPIMGFGRLTLIPKGDIIYKIAINEYGVRSNKNDFAVMNEIKGTPLMSKFAETTHTIGDYIINIMEKVKAGSSNEPSAAEASALGKEINNELEKMGIGFEIHDIKADAFGKKGDNYVLLDYGYLHRRTINAKKPNNNSSDNDDNK